MSATARLRAALAGSPELRPGEADRLVAAANTELLLDADLRIAALPQDFELDPGRGDARRLLRAMAETPDTTGVCARCGCTDDAACPGGCTWVANPRMLDLCSACIRPDGTCTTPKCGTTPYDPLGAAAPPEIGWVLEHVAGTLPPPTWVCSEWCAKFAIAVRGEQLAAADRADAAGGDRW
ncbi:hypothetical protein ACWEFL_15930 [Streptomyces sp. NPDC004838]